MIFVVVIGIFCLLAWVGLTFFSPRVVSWKVSFSGRVFVRIFEPFNVWRVAHFSDAPAVVKRSHKSGVLDYGLKAWKAGAPLGKLMVVTALVAAPVLIGTLYMSGTYRLLMPEHSSFANESQVVQVMNEAELVPPPALPPSIFAASKDQQQFQSADRDWQKLDAGFMQQVLQLIAGMKVYGYELVLLEGYRSPERQALLAERGANVTRAGAYQSKHQYGLAADMAFLREGKLVIAETDPWAMEGYQRLGMLAKQVGLTWGGGWSFQDYGHIESPQRISKVSQNKE